MANQNSKVMGVLGRKEAKATLDKKLKSNKAELIAIIGRRRIGKTYLIKNYLEKDIIFKFSGLYNGSLSEHLERFTNEVATSLKSEVPLTTPSSWFEAFDLLKIVIKTHKGKKKKVIFLDEFPWMATNKSRFLTAFTDFWNSFASERNDLIIIICGSAASWMINKVLKNKGGLYNRVTERIFLEPFTLEETKQFLVSKHIILSNYDIVKLYMAIGGVPYYLDQLEKGESTVQAIDRLCFAKNALLRLEYSELMASLFNNATSHQSIIEVLNKYPKGLLRSQIIEKTNLNSGGGATAILEELETSGFIASYVPYGKKNKDKIFKIKDQYLLFYHKFIKGTRPSSTSIWEKIFTSSSYVSWTGLAFENICLDHIDKIRQKLKIDGIHTTHSSWHNLGAGETVGAQIDLLIDRADGVINVCEMKFYNGPYTITKEYANALRHKAAIFNQTTGNKKAIFPTMITSFGLIENQHSRELIQQEVTMEDLF